MPTFKYKAKSNSGDTIEGTIDARSQDEAVERISKDGYFPTKIETVLQNVPARSERRVSGRVRSRDITAFSRQLSSLLRSGVSLLHALSVLSEQSENAALERMLERISSEIREGASFSAALSKYPKTFSPLYLAIVRAGEASGTMDESLSRIATYLRKQDELVSKVRMALVYPAFMALVGVAVTIFMLVYVIPKLAGVFETIGQKLPLPTQVVLALSEWLRDYWIWPLGGLVVAVFIVKQSARTGIKRLVFDQIMIRIPLLGRFFLKVELARFSRTMEALIKSGIPILEAIRTSAAIFGNDAIRSELERTREELESGGSFGRSLKRSRLFPVFMSNLITVGEESGRLDEVLGEVADSYERDTDEAVGASTALLEPLMILVVGAVVGFIIVAMLLPVFELDITAGM